jgi:signal transduction histidine kinase
VALTFLLGNLRRSAAPALTPAQQQSFSEALGLLQRCTDELRTLSYVLHPPLLDDQGLPSALKNYADGFAQRTGIEVQLAVDPAVTRFARETELVLFRVLQESLTNIQKHSGSRQACIRLALTDSQVVLEIHDSGQGFDVPDGSNGGGAVLGVGVVSMRERLKQLGGELVLASGTGGTTVRALLPVTIPSP